MPGKPISVPVEQVQLLGDALSLHELALCCRVSPDWVMAHVQAGVLHAEGGQGIVDWRFATATVVRARRIVQLERTWDADPQLAALTADLIEEVTALRRRLSDF